MMIVDKLTVDLDLSVFHGSYEKIEALIKGQDEGRRRPGGGEEAKEACGQEHDGGAKGYGGILEVTCPKLPVIFSSFLIQFYIYHSNETF